MGLKKFWKAKAVESKIVESKAGSQQIDACDPLATKSASEDTSAWGKVDSVNIVLEHLYSLGLSKGWFMNDLDDMDYDNIGVFDASVAVSCSNNDDSTMKCYPPIEGPFSHAVQNMGFAACLRIDSNIVHAIMDALANNPAIREAAACLIGSRANLSIENGVRLDDSIVVQVLESYKDLPRARKAQHAAFLRVERCLLVWSDELDNIMDEATALNAKMIQIAWTSNSKKGVLTEAVEVTDLESQPITARPTMYLAPFIVGMSIAILMVFIFLGLRTLLIEVIADQQYIRMGLLLTIPLTAMFTVFFCNVLAGSVLQLVGPINHMKVNSKHFSAIAPPRMTGPLPHITIQCPVYKESLVGVIGESMKFASLIISNMLEPTMKSIRAAITTYELQGGTASVFVNDDGMQLLEPSKAAIRQKYYASNNIGWVARPGHGVDGFNRAGRFKKASNMNFALRLAWSVENRLSQVVRGPNWTDQDEEQAYSQCMEETKEEFPLAWASGDIRVGDLILLIDSDTRVPKDCLLDAASEFHESPELGILQHSSGVMIVIDNYWEQCIAHFTRIIYFAIKYSCAAGDIAPFVGHNAFLRWRAVQEMVSIDELGSRSWWSESHVSEDFEMSLKLQLKGYSMRYATYSNDEFLEGVSLTVYDELARWQKYAYGCSELVFNPLRYWFVRGPFTKLFRTFLKSTIPGFSKYATLSYIFSYYAIASAWITCLVSYFLVGWFGNDLDQFYLRSWGIFLAVNFVFGLVAPFCNAVIHHRAKEGTFFQVLMRNYGWTFLLSLFLGGLSLHVSAALLCHLFSINMTWGITAKELDKSNFWIELPKIAKGFKGTYAFLIICIIGMIALATPYVPHGWTIRSLSGTLPLGWLLASHFAMPIVLNPQLMTFSF